MIDNVGDVVSGFLFISTHISLDLLSLSSAAEAYIGWGKKLNLMSSCARNIRTKNYQNLVIGFQVTVENVGNVFFRTQCMSSLYFVHVQFQYQTKLPGLLKAILPADSHTIMYRAGLRLWALGTQICCVAFLHIGTNYNKPPVKIL